MLTSHNVYVEFQCDPSSGFIAARPRISQSVSEDMFFYTHVIRTDNLDTLRMRSSDTATIRGVHRRVHNTIQTLFLVRMRRRTT